jgi:photosystem II stability/assembly factor-like uncharacterized protein
MTRRGAVLAMLPALAAGTAAAQPRVEPQRSGTTARLQAVSVVNADVVWASGARGTYLRTVNGGRTWTAGTVPGADSLEFRDVHGFDARRAVLLAAGPGERSRIYRTDDGGRRWEPVFTNRNPAAFYDCFDFRGSYGVAVSDAVNGRFPLLRSRNGGRSWESFEPPGYGSVRAVDGEGAFAASGTCVTLGGDGALWIVTAVGGRVIRFTGRAAVIAEPPVERGEMAGLATVAFRSERVGLAAGGDLGTPGAGGARVVVTADGGKTWRPGGLPPFDGAVYGAAFTRGPRGPAAVIVGPGGAAWSADDGATWQPLVTDAVWGLGFAAGGTGWLVGPEGRVLRVRLR